MEKSKSGNLVRVNVGVNVVTGEDGKASEKAGPEAVKREQSNASVQILEGVGWVPMVKEVGSVKGTGDPAV